MKTLTLKAEAFNSLLQSQITNPSEPWGPKHLQFATSLLNHLTDAEGIPIVLNDKQKAIMHLVFKPGENIQALVFKQTLADAGYELEEQSEKAFRLLFNATQLADSLAREINPKTGQPFITLEKKRGRKKETFTSLIATPQFEPQENKPEAEEPQAEVADPGDIAEAKPAPAKGKDNAKANR